MVLCGIITSWGVPVLSAVTSAVLVWFANYILNKWKKKQKDSIPPKLANHSFFTKMDYWINVFIPRIKVENKLKQEMIIKFLNIKFTVFKEGFRELVENSCDKSKEEECSCSCVMRVNDIFYSLIKEYEEKARANGIPDMFIDKFAEWHANTVMITSTAINGILESNYYDNCHERMSAILEILIFGFHLTITDAMKTLNGLNGELEQVLRKIKENESNRY